MRVAVSDITLSQGKAGFGNANKNAGDATVDFSAVLNGKVQDRQQQQTPSAGKTGGEQAAVATQACPPAVAQSAHVDLLADKLDAKLNGGVQADAAGATLSTPAAASLPATVPDTTATNQDADPALISDVAGLMALLAQTRPAAAEPSSPNGAAGDGDTVATTQAGLLTGSVAGLVAGAADAGGTPAADNVPAAPTGGTAAKDDAAAPSLATLDQGAATAQVEDTPALYLKTTPALDTPLTKSKPAPAAVTDKGREPTADATASAAQNNAALAAGTDPDSGQDFADVSPATILTLKKTSGVMFDAAATTTGAAAPVTPTLSAADAGANTTATPSSALISAQLGSDEWRQAIGQQVLMQVRNGQQNAELRLHPDNLGALQISLQMDGNNQAQIHLASGHSQVRSALEDALPQLRASLAESGIHLGQSSVGSDATPHWGGTGQDTAGGSRAATGFSIDAVPAPADSGAASTPATAGDRAVGIDTFA